MVPRAVLVAILVCTGLLLFAECATPEADPEYLTAVPLWFVTATGDTFAVRVGCTVVFIRARSVTLAMGLFPAVGIGLCLYLRRPGSD